VLKLEIYLFVHVTLISPSVNGFGPVGFRLIRIWLPMFDHSILPMFDHLLLPYSAVPLFVV